MYKNYLVLFYLILLMEENDFEIVIEPKLYIEMDRLKEELLKTQFELQKKNCDMEYLKKYNENLMKRVQTLNNEKNNLTEQNGLLINQKNTLQSEIQELKAKNNLINNLNKKNNTLSNNSYWNQKPILNPQHLFNQSPLYKIQSKLRKRRKNDY